MFSCLNTNSSSEWTACYVSHTPWSSWPFLLHSLITNNSSERTICRISHTHWCGCPFLLFCLIANGSYGSTVCPTSHTQLKSEPCLMYHSSQMFCIFLDGFLHHHLQLMHRIQFRQRDSNRSVVLAASCSSVAWQFCPTLPWQRGPIRN